MPPQVPDAASHSGTSHGEATHQGRRELPRQEPRDPGPSAPDPPGPRPTGHPQDHRPSGHPPGDPSGLPSGHPPGDPSGHPPGLHLPRPRPLGGKPALAVVGATGAAGAVMLQILSQHADVWGGIRLLASPRSAGRTLAVRGAETEVLALDEDALRGADVAVFLVPEDVAARWAPVAAAQGTVVVDASPAFRDDPEVPLVVPEVNPHAARVRPRGIIAGPGCTTLALIVAVGALHAEFGLEELVVSAYQAASGAGQAGVAALRGQLTTVAGTGLGVAPGDVRRAVGDDGTGPFPAPLALNVVPWSGTLQDGGWSSEELGVRAETRRVLGLPGLRVAATCVRVPVLTTHSVSVHARFERPVTVARAHEILATSPGVVLYDDPAAGDFPTPADVVGTDPTWVGRVRRDLDDERALEFFACGDNLRKGAALNTAQIAELVAAELAAGGPSRT